MKRIAINEGFDVRIRFYQFGYKMARNRIQNRIQSLKLRFCGEKGKYLTT